MEQIRKNKVYELRKKSRLTQQELSNQIGLSITKIRQIENTKIENIPPETALQLARAFNCSLEQFIELHR